MVTTFERVVSLGGIFSLYAYMGYKFVQSKTSFNRKYHDAMLNQGNKFEREISNPNFKMVPTPNDKILFLLGVPNGKDQAYAVQIAKRVIENFTPNAIFSKETFGNHLQDIQNLLVNEGVIDKEKVNTNIQLGYNANSIADDLQGNVDPNELLTTIVNLKEDERTCVFNSLANINKNLPFDVFNLYADKLRSSLTGNKCFPFIVGPEYMRVKSLIRKRLDMSEADVKDKWIGLNDISKLSIKERTNYKEHQLNVNSKYDIYEDIKKYIESELENEMEVQNLKLAKTEDGVSRVNIRKNRKIEAGLESVYKSVNNDINDIMMNNILDNKKVYIGLVLVRQERFQSLYDKFVDYSKNL